MPWTKLVSDPSSRWTQADGPHAAVALSSRIRLARNVEGIPFPHRMNEQQAAELNRRVEQGVREINLMGLPSKVELYSLADAPALDRQVLVDKHLISPQQASKGYGRSVAISEDESVSIMVNEEDHLRIQTLVSGLQLEEAWHLASLVDDAMEQRLPFAFDPKLGYLTACPTNVGTGLRASVMMHLPGLVMTHQAGQVFQSLSQVGLVVRGLYGEGTDATGHIFQISNQTSLGKTEEEIINHLKGVVERVMEAEKQARKLLLEQNQIQLEDRISRSYGLLCSARILSSEEAMKLLSDVRLGIDLGLFPKLNMRTINELMVAMQPAFLQRMAGRELSPMERDIRRAALVRSRFAS